MRVEFNKVTWYSRLFTILFIFGAFPCLIFFIGTRYQETVSVLTYAEASAYNLHATGTYEAKAYAGPGSMHIERNLVGEWVSDTDAGYAMRIKNINTFYDLHNSKVIASGSWLIVDSLVDTPFASLPIKGFFLQKNTLNDKGDEMIQYYKVEVLNEEHLVLQYLDRGNTLSFTKKNLAQ